jgi:hypothetical protein
MFISSSAFAFGQNGHRITGQLAERYLSEEAKIAIKAILGNESLAEVSTYPDEQRSSGTDFWNKTGPWHYMTVPDGETYTDKLAPEEGDVITALRMFTAQLKDPNATKEQRALALKFIVHLVGDIHQPLHVGNGTDRGGNDVKVLYQGQPSNLHRVWDTNMIEGQNLSFTEWTNWLATKITAQELEDWSSIDPLVWARESQEIRMTIYPDKEQLGWDYQREHLPTVKLRLKQASVRLALYLNDLFK